MPAQQGVSQANQSAVCESSYHQAQHTLSQNTRHPHHYNLDILRTFLLWVTAKSQDAGITYTWAHIPR